MVPAPGAPGTRLAVWPMGVLNWRVSPGDVGAVGSPPWMLMSTVVEGATTKLSLPSSPKTFRVVTLDRVMGWLTTLAPSGSRVCWRLVPLTVISSRTFPVVPVKLTMVAPSIELPEGLPVTVRSDRVTAPVTPLMRKPKFGLLRMVLFATDSDPTFWINRPSNLPLFWIVAPLTDAVPVTLRRSTPAPALLLKELVPVMVTPAAEVMLKPVEA